MSAGKTGSCRGYSVIEYLMVSVLVCGALLIMGSYIHRAFQGQFRRSGEAMADLRQHGGQISRDCLYDDQLGFWYSEKCFDHYVRHCRQAPPDEVNHGMFCHKNIRRCICDERDIPADMKCTAPGDEMVQSTCPTLCCQQSTKLKCARICQKLDRKD